MMLLAQIEASAKVALKNFMIESEPWRFPIEIPLVCAPSYFCVGGASSLSLESIVWRES